jgi:hypothetical protein
VLMSFAGQTLEPRRHSSEHRPDQGSPLLLRCRLEHHPKHRRPLRTSPQVDDRYVLLPYRGLGPGARPPGSQRARKRRCQRPGLFGLYVSVKEGFALPSLILTRALLDQLPPIRNALSECVAHETRSRMVRRRLDE